MRVVLIVAALGGCGEPAGLGREDLGMNDVAVTTTASNPSTGGSATDEGGDPADPTVSVVDETCEPGGMAGPTLTLTADPGVVHVVHGPFDDSACAAWAYELVVVDDRLEVAYVDEATAPCVDSCDWTLTYDLLDVPSGLWTVAVDGLEGAVDVP